MKKVNNKEDNINIIDIRNMNEKMKSKNTKIIKKVIENIMKDKPNDSRIKDSIIQYVINILNNI